MELERAAEDKVQLTERSGEADLSCVCLRDTGQNVPQSLRRRLDSRLCSVTVWCQKLYELKAIHIEKTHFTLGILFY